MIRKRLIAVGLLLSGILNLFGCGTKGNPEPFLRDGDGMVYVDENYRTEYANALPFDEYNESAGSKVFAAVYLGKGENGRQNVKPWVDRLFAGKLAEEKLNQISLFDLGGEDWFLVIPRYCDECVITPNNDSYQKQSVYNGVPFTINCDEVTLYISAYGGKECILKSDGNGKIADEEIWDISDLPLK